MRLFVAVTPPPEIREAAVREARRLFRGSDLRWSPPENVHLTLKFLGDTPEERIGAIEGSLRPVCARSRPLELALEGIGGFPSLRRARTLWVGVGGESGELSALAEEVEAALEELGFERERRPFHPHVTVGRSRDGAVTGTADTDAGPLGFRAESVELVRSRLSERGASYSAVASFPLGPATEGLQDGEERPDGHQDKEKYQDHDD